MTTSAASPHGGTRRRLVLALAAAGAVAVLAATLLSGCTVQAAIDTTVNPDGSGEVGVSLAADKAAQDSLSDATSSLGGKVGGILDILGELGGFTSGIPTSADELFNLIMGKIPGDWDVQRGTDASGVRWVKLTRSFSDPEELQEILSGTLASSVMTTDQVSLTQDKGLFRTKTAYSATADAGSVTSRLEKVTGIASTVLGDVLVVENRVTLPGSVGDHNADEVQGNTLMWTLSGSGAREMRAESTTYHWRALVGVMAAAAIVIALIVVALVLLLRRRRHPGPPKQSAKVEPVPAAVELVPAAAPGTEDLRESTPQAPESR